MPLDDEDLRLRVGRRVSLLEAILWLAGFCLYFASPQWFGLSSLPVLFYGTLCALTWRLCKAMPVTHAMSTAIVVAVIITAIMVPIVQL
jgi:hypothetical protein